MPSFEDSERMNKYLCVNIQKVHLVRQHLFIASCTQRRKNTQSSLLKVHLCMDEGPKHTEKNILKNPYEHVNLALSSPFYTRYILFKLYKTCKVMTRLQEVSASSQGKVLHERPCKSQPDIFTPSFSYGLSSICGTLVGSWLRCWSLSATSLVPIWLGTFIACHFHFFSPHFLPSFCSCSS